MNNILTRLRFILVALLFLCLADMPYGYYMFVRVVAMVTFGLLAYTEFHQGNKNIALVFLVSIIVFQPLVKISFGRTLWNIIDVVMAIILIATYKPTEENK